MTICAAIVIACLLFMVPLPRKYYWRWTACVLFLLSAVFFFYQPLITDDLYRYYIVLDSVRGGIYSSYSLLETFHIENPLFIPYLWAISLLQVNAFLPVITGVICYAMLLWLLKRTFPDTEGYNWQITVCLCMLLFLTRFMDITGIRNILSSTIIAIALYLDLVERNKKAIAFYIIGSLIHGIGLIYVILRLVLLLYRKIYRFIIPVILLFSSLIITLLSDVVSLLLSRSAMGAGLYNRLLLYMNNQSSLHINERYRLLFSFVYVFVLVISLLYERYFDANSRYKTLSDFIILLVFFTFSFWEQRELFNRERLIIIPLGIVFVGELLKRTSRATPLSFVYYKKKGKKATLYTISAIAVYGFLVFSIIYFILVVNYDYTHFNSGFIF